MSTENPDATGVAVHHGRGNLKPNGTGILFPELEAERVPFKPTPGFELDIERFSVLRPTWNLKRTVRFLSIRKWRLSDKRGGIDAVKLAKENHGESLAAAIAGELSGAIRLFLGSAGFRITAPPQGASCKWGDWRLASRAANITAASLGVEYRAIFAARPRSGGSHPKTFNSRGSAEFIAEPERGRLIVLVDDLATSGSTIEECAAKLRAFGPVVAIAWLYEGVEDAHSGVR